MNEGDHPGHNPEFLHLIENLKEEERRNVGQFHPTHQPGGDELFAVVPERGGL
jgi:hypothetical protein